jgi:hypothetical protein
VKPYTDIQLRLWKLAHFDSFFVGFCPTMYNTIAGIGLYFVLQLVIVFISAFTICSLWIASAPYIAIPFAGILSWLFFKWIKVNAGLQHEYNDTAMLFAVFVINFIIALIITLPLCISLFKGQIDFQIYLDYEQFERNFFGQVQQQANGLFQICRDEERGGDMISFFCISSFLIVLFMLFTPYVLIWKTLKSIHNIVLGTYEQKFNKPG